MEKTKPPTGIKQEDFRYSKIPGPIDNALFIYLLVSVVKGIIWLVKTPIKWVIKKLK